jgi:DNA-binding transcriptional LysR family regulator
MEFDGTDSVKRAVQQGLGIGIALRSGVEWEIEQGLLKEVPLRAPPPRVDLALVYHPRWRQSPMVQAFTAYLRDQLSERLRRHGEEAAGAVCPDGVSPEGQRAPRRLAARH